MPIHKQNSQERRGGWPAPSYTDTQACRDPPPPPPRAKHMVGSKRTSRRTSTQALDLQGSGYTIHQRETAMQVHRETYR